MSNKLLHYMRLMRLDKPSAIGLLLWPTLWALWIASQGKPTLGILLIFVLGTLVMRSAGCVINDFADRNFDPHVARTRNRPLASKVVSVKEALILFAVLCFIALLLVLQLNALTIKLSFIAVLLAIIYPFTKRFLHCPQFALGLAWYWSIPMAFAATLNYLPSVTWLVYITAAIWPIVYDTMYAMADREDDRKIGIKSAALLFGNYDRFWIGIFQLFVLILLTYIGIQQKLSLYYFISLLFAAGFSIYQQYLLRNRLPADCLRAFRNNNWFGIIVFLGFVIGFILK